MMKDCLDIMRREMTEVLEKNILPFWMNRMVDTVHGGFYGRVTGEDELMPEAVKGAVLNARILWTFAAVYRVLGKREYLDMANRAKRTLIDCFYDRVFGGIYWSVDFCGSPLDTKKQVYALGFALYGLSEYVRATGDEEALDYAVRLYECIEKYSHDLLRNGYWEAFTREWGDLQDMRLSDKDANERKTMNTHLHVLEAYANLCRVWRNERVEQSLRNVIRLFLDRIWNKETGHLGLFFDDEWTCKSCIISYGHEIEASWLVYEAALVLNDERLLAEVGDWVRIVAESAAEGLNKEGGMMYERRGKGGRIDGDCHWWVQAETVVGYLNLYQHWQDERALLRAFRCWEFIKKNLIDYKNGEWHWSVYADGRINTEDDKAGLWKCPYHNSRMCIEVIERFGCKYPGNQGI